MTCNSVTNDVRTRFEHVPQTQAQTQAQTQGVGISPLVGDSHPKLKILGACNARARENRVIAANGRRTG